MDTYRIMTFDGGGVKVVGFAKYVEYLERRFDQRLNTRLQAVAGTSAGAIMAVLVSLGVPSEEIIKRFEANLPLVFKPQPLWKRYLPFGSKYQSINLKQALVNVLGEHYSVKMCDLPLPTYIPVTDLNSLDTKVHDQNDEDLVVDVLLKTCSAPYYFDPVDGMWVDGGLWANNPSLVGLTGFIRHNPGVRLEEIRLYSLGHGQAKYKNRLKYAKYFTYLNWAIPLLDFMSESHEDGNDFYCSQLPLQNYRRIEVETQDVKLDGLRDLPFILNQWETFIQSKEFESKSNS